MSDNVIKFQRPKPPKQLRHMPLWLRRLLTLLALVAVLAAVWAYFYLSGSEAPTR
ncbi:hypothetical protein [Neorhizobium lilium]|uniref:hypothetical protein n=1 Tax=Neorhizobium lilium TaxID=2503024 RepID=UPI0013E3FC38|nr:hypothetical protein [Neorhizobium lilium]